MCPTVFYGGRMLSTGRQTIWQQTWPIRGQTKVIKGRSETFQNLVLNMLIFWLHVHFFVAYVYSVLYVVGKNDIF